MTITPMMKKLQAKMSKPLPTPQMQHKWAQISRYLTSNPIRFESYGYLIINTDDEQIRMVKKRGHNIMRLKSRLDWVWYDPQQLAQAIDNNTVLDYYTQQLNDPRSYHNDWKRLGEEIDTKQHYAHRAGRFLDPADNI